MIKLATSGLSPFGHRVEMTLHEKKLAFEKVEIDLGNKPDWFKNDSPLGKIPIFYDDNSNKALFESIAICEYIDEKYPQNPLHPQDPHTKAWNRGWMEFCNNIIAAAFGLAFAADEKTMLNKKDELHGKMVILQKYLTNKPYFNGDKLALIDIFFATTFTPLMLLESNYQIDIFGKNSVISTYCANLNSLESFSKIIPSNYEEIFKNLLIRKNSILLKK